MARNRDRGRKRQCVRQSEKVEWKETEVERLRDKDTKRQREGKRRRVEMWIAWLWKVK